MTRLSRIHHQDAPIDIGEAALADVLMGGMMWYELFIVTLYGLDVFWYTAVSLVYVNVERVTTMSPSTHFRVKAIFHDGMLVLQDPLNLPEGAQVQLDVKLMSAAADSPVTPGAYPNRFVPAACFDALIGLIPVGGDALADSEALYDPDWS
jgi:hypothetical protein